MRHAPTDFVAATAKWPERWRNEFEERAAIIEFDAGEDRHVAERKAFAQVFKLMKAGEK